MLTVLLLPALGAAAGCSDPGRAESGSASLLEDIKSRGAVRIGSRVDNPPHSSYDDQGRWVGFDNDIATALAKRWGVRLEMVKVDELTRISFLQNGKIDLAVASISKTKKRGEKVDFSQTYFRSAQTFVVRKGTAASYRDLVGKRVGASRGSSSIGNWTAWLKRNGVTAEPDIEQFGDKRAALAAVKQGAIAGWTEDYEVLASYARNEPDLNVLNVPGGTGVKLDGIAMRKNDSTLRMAVNLALQDIADSGEYDRIYDRWFGPTSTAPVPRQGDMEVWPNG
jgi:polar amino acid transport system substrate-binding protein